MILDGDAEANVAHFCLQKLHVLPSAFLALPREERAFIIASIEVRIESEKKAAKDAKAHTGGRRYSRRRRH